MPAYTEKEAKTKWCPYIRLSYAEKLFFTNREILRSDSNKTLKLSCIGSDCMQWKYIVLKIKDIVEHDKWDS